MFIGIDVGCTHLDLAASAAAPALPRRVPNTAEGIARLISAVTRLSPTLIVLEATGVYHEAAALWFVEAGAAVSVVNPAQAKAFGQGLAVRTQTDARDSQVLAR